MRCENFALSHNKRLLRADPCFRSVIKEFAHAFSCAYIELWMHVVCNFRKEIHLKTFKRKRKNVWKSSMYALNINFERQMGSRFLKKVYNMYYNIARVLALCKSYWAAMNKIFIYARPCVNKTTWAFFLPGIRVSVLLSCSAVFLFFEIWKKPAKNCPIFLSALTFYSPDTTSNKSKAEKNSQTSCSKFWPKTFTGNKKRHQLVINNI